MNLLIELITGLAREDYQRRRLRQNRLKLIRTIEKKLQTAHESHNDATEVRLMVQLADLRASSSEFQLADPLYKQAADLAHYMQDKTLEMSVLLRQGHSYKQRMVYSRAASYYRQAQTIAHELEDEEAEQEISGYLVEVENMKKFEELSREVE